MTLLLKGALKMVFFVTLVGGAAPLHFAAKFLKTCPKNGPNLKNCLKNAIEGLRPLMAGGIPALGIPKCEPLRIPLMVIDEGRSPIFLRSTYRDIEVWGPTNFTVSNVKVDLDHDRVKIRLHFPKLTVNSNYTMTGQILLMPISGSGLSFGNYSNIDAVVSMKMARVVKNQEEYYNVAECAIDFDIGAASLRFDNLFNGNAELGEATNLFLNDNWRTVTDEIKPALEGKLAELFKQFANEIFHKFPIDVLFPKL